MKVASANPPPQSQVVIVSESILPATTPSYQQLMASIQGNKHLPQDLAREILVRLPVKSLARFRCVHTSWNALFRTRTFVADHYSYSSRHERLVMFRDYYKCDAREYNTIVVHNDDPSQPPRHVPLPPAPLAYQDKELRLIVPYGSSCNGIFFISVVYADDTFQLMLWNPGTRDVKLVPTPPRLISYKWHSQLPCHHHSFGFGVDRETNDYKIVSIMLSPYEDDANIYTEVYSVSTESWTSTIHDDVPRVTIYLEDFLFISSTHAKGVCHWFCSSECYSYFYEESGILCFDLSNSQFKLIKLPIINNYDRPNNNLGRVGVYRLSTRRRIFPYERSFFINDSIAFVARYRDLNNLENENYRLEVWVFNEADGDEGSWTRTHDIEPFNLEPQVFGFWKATGEFLATTGFKEYLVSLDYDGQPVRKIQTDTRSLVHNYVESIAPLSI